MQTTSGTAAATPTGSESLPPRSEAPLVARLAGVRRTFPGRRRRPAVIALEDMALEVARHEVVAVLGPSGCGKSTLLEVLCGLQPVEKGTVQARPAAYLPQRDGLLPWASALDNAALALRLTGVDRSRARERARPVFERLGLEGFEGAFPHELSGGMRQRVAIARTLLCGRELLALDEPFAALDALTRRELQGWLQAALGLEPRSVVLVTHDAEEAAVLADRVVVMAGRPGRVRSELTVGLPRPRRAGQPEIVVLRERALAALATEPPPL